MSGKWRLWVCLGLSMAAVLACDGEASPGDDGGPDVLQDAGSTDAGAAETDAGPEGDPCDPDPCANGTCTVSGEDFRCDCEDGWEGERCEAAIDCGDPGEASAPLSVDLSEGTAFGATATYACAEGFALVGDATRTCGAAGWSGATPSCEATVICRDDSCGGNGVCAVVDGAIACTCDEGWTGESCEARVDCGALSPTDPQLTVAYAANGAAESTGVGAVATYACNDGYRLTGAPTTTICQQSGAWAPPGEPTCVIVDCGAPPSGANLSVVLDDGTTTFGSDASYTCTAGFALEGDASARCGADGSWSGARSCAEITCSAYAPSNMDLTVTNPADTAFGDTVSFACSGDRVLSGGSAITCGAGTGSAGAWSGTEPTCADPPPMCETSTCSGNGTCVESGGVFARCDCDVGWTGTFCDTRVDCEAITPAGDFLSVSYTPNTSAESTGVGATATYSCATGTTLVGTPVTRTCGADGVWSPSGEPSCELVDCGAPPGADANGSVMTDRTTYLGTASYACDTGYALNGTSMLTCLASGAWSGSAPACEIVRCGAAPTANGAGSELTSSTGEAFGATASYRCATGYTGEGGSLSCAADGSWTGTELSCALVDCGAPSTPEGGSVDVSATTFGASATYACDAGSTLIGASSALCQADGTWSAPAPRCALPTCTLTYDLHDSRFFIRNTLGGAGDSDIAGDGTDAGPLSGLLVVRVPSSSGAPAAGLAEILEYRLEQSFVVASTVTVTTDVTASAGDGTAAVATGALTLGGAPTLAFADCALPEGTDVNSTGGYTPDVMGTGAGCLAPYRSVGVVNCDGGSFLCGFGALDPGDNPQDETWEQPLNELVLASDFSTLTMSTAGAYTRTLDGYGAMAIPNRTPSTTWLHWAGSLVSMVCE